MNDNKDLYDIASGIMDKVSRAAAGNNFADLSREINDDINRYNTVRKPARRQVPVPFLMHRPGKAVPIIKQLIGWPGLVVFLSSMLGVMVDGDTAATFVTAVFSAGFGWLSVTGMRQKQRTDDFFAYARAIGDGEYISVAELSGRTGQSAQHVQKSLTAMMREGLLPTARFDDSRQTLILTENAWHQYEAARAAYLSAKNETAADSAVNAPAAGRNTTVAEECDAFTREIQRANDHIADETMSYKLNLLAIITAKIADQVRKDPGSAANLRKFLNYYVPTTRKLLDAYVVLNSQITAGENIAATKHEIEDAMDAIIRAYETILDSLFEDVAWDISSDISVMKTMMAQDGLTRDDLNPADKEA